MASNGSDFLYVVAGIVLLIIGAIAKRRRRARMTPEERGLEDIAYELRQTRRENRWRSR